jgi:L-rhamnose isomerase
MKQRMSTKRHAEVEEATGMKVRSMWHRGGRNPRYYDVFFGEEGDTEGKVGFWIPDSKRIEWSDIGWKTYPPKNPATPPDEA